MTITKLISELQFMYELYNEDGPIFIRDESGFRYEIRECEEYDGFFVLEPVIYDNNWINWLFKRVDRNISRR